MVNAACIVCNPTIPASTTSCGATMFATACASGFYATGGNCVACSTGGKTCDATGVLAGGCNDGYYLASLACVKCMTGSATCTTSTDATTCISGYSKIGSATTCT